MKPRIWFSLAAALFGAAVAMVELGVRAYVNDDRWDKALADETKTDGATAKRE